MQFLENSLIGVRAACHQLRGPPGSPDVCLFPMIHIGAPEYYAEVSRRLATCDVVLFEGVGSVQAWWITRSYALATHRKRLGLVLQSDAIDRGLLKSRGIHSDVTAQQFRASWGEIPLRYRLALLTLCPLYGVWVYLTGTRESIGRRMSVEEVESQSELFERVPELQDVIVTSRDAKLVENLAAAVANSGPGKRLGVIYGAAHMSVASRLLTGKFKYRVAESEWITVFGYE